MICLTFPIQQILTAFDFICLYLSSGVYVSFVTTCFVPFVTICTHFSQFVIIGHHLSSLSPFQAISHHLLMSQFDSIVSISHYLTPVLTTRLRCHHLSSPFHLTNFDCICLHLSQFVRWCLSIRHLSQLVLSPFVTICGHLSQFTVYYLFTKIFVAATSRTKSNKMNSYNLLRRQNSVTETKIGTNVFHKHEEISRCNVSQYLLQQPVARPIHTE